MRLDFLLEVARFLKEQRPGISLRINTNGLADLIYNEPTAHKLQGLIDTVSISLNAYNKEEYLAVTARNLALALTTPCCNTLWTAKAMCRT